MQRSNKSFWQTQSYPDMRDMLSESFLLEYVKSSFPSNPPLLVRSTNAHSHTGGFRIFEGVRLRLLSLFSLLALQQAQFPSRA